MKHFDLGGAGQPLHFLHANGYPPECYKPLLELLKTQYRVFGMLLRPLWEGANLERIRSWHVFSDDLFSFLTGNGIDRVVGVGHSIGAVVTLRAALRYPGKFIALVLIDPVLFVPGRLILWNIIRMIGLGRKLHPKISGAMKRRHLFDNLEKVFRGYRNREVFRYMSDENLRIYIEGMTRPTKDGKFELVFSPEWEAQIYYTGLRDYDIWHDLPSLKVPTLLLRGIESDTFLQAAEGLVKQKQPGVKTEAFPRATHLLPLERPVAVFNSLQSFLKEVL